VIFAPEDLTNDKFLGGRVVALQPRGGYRAGVDPVLLAASVPAVSGQSVLELGCGAGVATLCLAARVPSLNMAGLELQPAYADLARQNAVANGVALDLFVGDLARIPVALRARTFDHVIANPPYYIASDRTKAADNGRETALTEDTPLVLWVEAAVRRLAPRGYLTVIQDVRRLPELLGTLDRRLGDVTVTPIMARTSKPATRVILRARKGARGPFSLTSPVIMHDGDGHDGDRESYTRQIKAVLRDGAAIFPPPC
jgi:tRNA1Val (adenine37-N6)-methyltransferase